MKARLHCLATTMRVSGCRLGPDESSGWATESDLDSDRCVG